MSTEREWTVSAYFKTGQWVDVRDPNGHVAASCRDEETARLIVSALNLGKVSLYDEASNTRSLSQETRSE